LAHDHAFETVILYIVVETAVTARHLPMKTTSSSTGHSF